MCHPHRPGRWLRGIKTRSTWHCSMQEVVSASGFLEAEALLALPPTVQGLSQIRMHTLAVRLPSSAVQIITKYQNNGSIHLQGMEHPAATA